MVLVFLTVAGFLMNVSPAFADVIRISGTGSALGTITLLSSAYSKRHPECKVHVLQSIGSSGAIKAISQGALDIGLISRKLKPEELRLGLLVTSVARTPFVFAVGRSVPVSGVTHGDLLKILKGEILKWPNGERIRVVLRPAADADTIIARSISPEMRVAIDNALAREGMLMALTSQEALDLIEKTPGSFGFSSLSQIESENRSIKMLSYNGVSPTAKNIATGAYPHSMKFSLITKPDVSPSVRQFIDFVRSKEGQMLLKKTGNLPI
jgi:phosphate transport system substrate-binding protein